MSFRSAARLSSGDTSLGCWGLEHGNWYAGRSCRNALALGPAADASMMTAGVATQDMPLRTSSRMTIAALMLRKLSVAAALLTSDST